MSWTVLFILAAGCYLTKLLGYAVPAHILETPTMQRIAALTPVAMLTALILTQTITEGSSFVLEPRLAGVIVAVILTAWKAPFPLIILSAMATTAAVNYLV